VALSMLLSSSKDIDVSSCLYLNHWLFIIYGSPYFKANNGYTRPEEGYERVLWGDLKTMFEHHIEDVVWRNLRESKVLVWKLFDSGGVHFVRF
ncbi:hypothetical protein Tco_0207936, partial [Tanacetum coccineum]